VFLRWSTPAAPVTVDAVLAVAQTVVGSQAVGMISSPVRHDLVRLDGERLVTSSGPAELDEVFQLRLFTPKTELRWVHTGSRRGTAVTLSESDAGPEGWTMDSADVDEVLDGQYALWGRRFMPLASAGWCRAVEGRIGWIDVPAATPTPSDPERDWPEQYLALCFREYLTSDEHGNATVLDERLTGITVATTQFNPGQSPSGGQRR
jgi:CRISPR-associated protein (TIGR03984 family)